MIVLSILRIFLKSALNMVLIPCAILLALGASLSAQSIQTTAPIAFLYDVGTQSALYEKGPDTLFAPASIIKLLTAETVFTELKSGRVVPTTEYPITEQIWRRGGAPSRGSAMFAAVNSRVAIADLLQGLVVMSGNDAALALAEGIAGSEAAFVLKMQERAKAIGLTRSVFRNATGFSHPEQRVTAREMAKLSAYIIDKHPEFYPLFGQKEFTWNAIRQLNRNPLLSMNIGADGLKTGNIGEAGFGLVGSAFQDGRRLIVVILGAETAQIRSVEARKLLEWGFSNFERKTLLDKKAPLIEARVTGGTAGSVPLGIAETLMMLLPKSRQDVVETRIRYQGPLQAPLAEGAEVGQLQVLRSGHIVLETPVITLNTVAQGSLFKRAFDNSWEWLIGLFRRNSAGK